MSSPPPNIDERLKELDLKLKGLDTWVKWVALVGGIIGLVISGLTGWNTWNQIQLTNSQEQRARDEEKEKQRVNVKLELKAFSGPAKNAVYLTGTLTNNSARRIDVAMLGLRIWKRDWRSDIQDDPVYLVYSENMIFNCPPQICPAAKTASPKEPGRTKLWDPGKPTSLAPGETQSDTYGPYYLQSEEWKGGVWIEGRVYTVEQDDGKCVVVGPPELEGTFPAFCEERRAKEPACYKAAGCLYDAPAPFFYKPAGGG